MDCSRPNETPVAMASTPDGGESDSALGAAPTFARAIGARSRAAP